MGELDKVKNLGLDTDLLINEVSGAVLDRVQEQIDEIKSGLTAAVNSLQNTVNEIKEGLPRQAQAHAEIALKANLDSIRQEINSQFDNKLAQLGNPSGAETSIAKGGSAIEQLLPSVLERLLKGGEGDSLDAFLGQAEKFGKIKMALDNLGGPSVSSDAQWRFGQQAFIEGIKVGKVGKSGASASPLLPEPLANPSAKLGEHTLKFKRKTDSEIIKEILG